MRIKRELLQESSLGWSLISCASIQMAGLCLTEKFTLLRLFEDSTSCSTFPKHTVFNLCLPVTQRHWGLRESHHKIDMISFLDAARSTIVASDLLTSLERSCRVIQIHKSGNESDFQRRLWVHTGSWDHGIYAVNTAIGLWWKSHFALRSLAWASQSQFVKRDL